MKSKKSIEKDAHWADRILAGVEKSSRRLVEETALKGGSLVIKRDDVIQHVPAKELLKTLPPKV